MSGKICSCGVRFRDAEDFRDHMPCAGTPEEQTIAKLQTRLDIAENALDQIGIHSEEYRTKAYARHKRAVILGLTKDW